MQAVLYPAAFSAWAIVTTLESRFVLLFMGNFGFPGFLWTNAVVCPTNERDIHTACNYFAYGIIGELLFYIGFQAEIHTVLLFADRVVHGWFLDWSLRYEKEEILYLIPFCFLTITIHCDLINFICRGPAKVGCLPLNKGSTRGATPIFFINMESFVCKFALYQVSSKQVRSKQLN